MNPYGLSAKVFKIEGWVISEMNFVGVELEEYTLTHNDMDGQNFNIIPSDYHSESLECFSLTFSENICDLILNNETSCYRLIKFLDVEPYIGMSEEEASMSRWGEPADINKTTTSYGISEQWCYDNYKYLYFENGILTSIQE